MPKVPESRVGFTQKVTSSIQGIDLNLIAKPQQQLRQLLLVGQEALKKREHQQQDSYTNGQTASAISEWSKVRDKLRQGKGASSIAYTEEYANFLNTYVQKVVNKAPNKQIGNKVLNSLSRLRNSELKSLFVERDREFKKVNMSFLRQDLDSIRTKVREDWRNFDVFFIDGDAKLRFAVKTGYLSSEQYVDEVEELRVGMSEDSLTGWFREQQQNKLSLVEGIRTGTLSNRDVDVAINQLTSQQKEKLANKLLKEHMSVIRAENDEFINGENAEKHLFEDSLRKFYLDEGDREEIFERIKLSRFMPPEKIEKLQNILLGKNDTDDERVLFDIRRKISLGEISKMEQLMEYFGEGLSISTATRTLIPVMEAEKDSSYVSAKNELAKKLGVPQGIVVIDPNAARREEEAALFELEQFRADNPEGDFKAKARKILDERQEKISVYRKQKIEKKKSQIDALSRVYEKNKSQLLAEKIVSLKRALEQLEKLDD